MNGKLKFVNISKLRATHLRSLSVLWSWQYNFHSCLLLSSWRTSRSNISFKVDLNNNNSKISYTKSLARSKKRWPCIKMQGLGNFKIIYCKRIPNFMKVSISYVDLRAPNYPAARSSELPSQELSSRIQRSWFSMKPRQLWTNNPKKLSKKHWIELWKGEHLL